MKVLIIEDDSEIVEFVDIAFEVGWPETKLLSTHQGNSGVELVENESPDVVILDLGLPDISGFEVLKQIRLFSKVPIIIVTVRDSEADIVKGLELGADEYVVKPFGQLGLLARVKAILRRHHALDTLEPLICGPLQFDYSSGQLILESTKIHLSRTEGLIIHLLMQNAGRVVTHSKLAEAIWGDTYPGSADALRVYIRRLRAKIEGDARYKGLILSSPGIGYTLELPA